MELAIKISDSVYNTAKRYSKDKQCVKIYEVDDVFNAVANGIPLPKGHGDLVDISPYKGKVICSHLYSGVKKLIEVDSIEPIIEADRKKQK